MWIVLILQRCPHDNECEIYGDSVSKVVDVSISVGVVRNLLLMDQPLQDEMSGTNLAAQRSLN